MHVSERLRKDVGLSLAWSMTASNTSIGSLGWMDMSAGARVGWGGGGGILGELRSGTKDDLVLALQIPSIASCRWSDKVSKYPGARRGCRAMAPCIDQKRPRTT